VITPLGFTKKSIKQNVLTLFYWADSPLDIYFLHDILKGMIKSKKQPLRPIREAIESLQREGIPIIKTKKTFIDKNDKITELFFYSLDKHGYSDLFWKEFIDDKYKDLKEIKNMKNRIKWMSQFFIPDDTAKKRHIDWKKNYPGLSYLEYLIKRGLR
jgi:hypothetical protein